MNNLNLDFKPDQCKQSVSSCKRLLKKTRAVTSRYLCPWHWAHIHPSFSGTQIEHFLQMPSLHAMQICLRLKRSENPSPQPTQILRLSRCLFARRLVFRTKSWASSEVDGWSSCNVATSVGSEEKLAAAVTRLSFVVSRISEFSWRLEFFASKAFSFWSSRRSSVSFKSSSICLKVKKDHT